jgi:hypothetical protein
MRRCRCEASKAIASDFMWKEWQMKLYRMAGLAIVVMVLANPVFAQNVSKVTTGTRANAAAMAQAMENAMTPGAGQARLEPMIGNFDVRIRAWVDPSKPPVESTAFCVNVWVLGHRYIQSMLSGYVLNEPFEGIGYTAYDNVTKTYETAWMDTGSTGMTWYRGGFDGATKSAKMKATVPNALTGKPTPLELRLSIAESGDHMSELWGQGAGGKMFKMMELRYTRSKQ